MLYPNTFSQGDWSAVSSKIAEFGHQIRRFGQTGIMITPP